MFANLEKVMGGTAEKLSNNKVLIAIRDGFLVIPILWPNSSAKVGKTTWML